jgi:hypothetical protein
VASGAPLIGRACLRAGVEEAVHELSSDMRREALDRSMVCGSSSFHERTIGTSQVSLRSPHSPSFGVWRPARACMMLDGTSLVMARQS